VCHDPLMNESRAGWYPDPSPDATAGRTERYWDGFSWSHQVRRSQSLAPARAGTPYPDRSYTAPRAIPTTPDGQLLAGWWRRAGATVLDSVIMIPLLALVATPSLVAHWHSVTTWWQAGYRSPGTLVTAGSAPNPPVLDPATGPGLILYASLFVASLAYTVVFLHWKQATPGKLLAGLQVRLRDTQGPLAWTTIVRRVSLPVAVAVVSQVPVAGVAFLVLGVSDYLWPLWDGNRQALHDKIAGTNVVVTASRR
jgi:uncharacterized RDD family membrane protein YckC